MWKGIVEGNLEGFAEDNNGGRSLCLNFEDLSWTEREKNNNNKRGIHI